MKFHLGHYYEFKGPEMIWIYKKVILQIKKHIY